MLRRISILGGDLRQRWLAEKLRQCGFEVAVYQVPELENTFSSLQQTVKSAQALALRRFIHANDPHAFMVITASTEIVGKGFLAS